MITTSMMPTLDISKYMSQPSKKLEVNCWNWLDWKGCITTLCELWDLDEHLTGQSPCPILMTTGPGTTSNDADEVNRWDTNDKFCQSCNNKTWHGDLVLHLDHLLSYHPCHSRNVCPLLGCYRGWDCCVSCFLLLWLLSCDVWNLLRILRFSSTSPSFLLLPSYATNLYLIVLLFVVFHWGHIFKKMRAQEDAEETEEIKRWWGDVERSGPVTKQHMPS